MRRLRDGVKRLTFDRTRFVINDRRYPVADSIGDRNGRIGIGSARIQVPVDLRRIERRAFVGKIFFNVGFKGGIEGNGIGDVPAVVVNVARVVSFKIWLW